MPIGEQQKSNLVNNFTTLVRQFQLPGVEVQRLGMAFRMTLEAIEPGQPVDLQSLFDYLTVEQKVAEGVVCDFCVVLKSREDRFGVTFQVPQKVQYLPAEQVERIVNNFNARTGGATTFDKKAEPAKGGAPAPAWEPSKVKKGAAPVDKTRIYAALLAVSVVGAVGFFGWRQANLAPEIVPLQIEKTSTGLPCASAVTDGTTAICDIPQAFWNAGPEETLRARAEQTKASLRARGVNRLMVRIQETGKIVIDAR